MRDPITAPNIFVRATEPLARTLSLRTLPYHVHEILPAFGFYTFLYRFAAPQVCRSLFPGKYNALPEKGKRNWDIHLVSLVQSCLINTAALSVIYLDKERWEMSPFDRVWGYTGASGMVQGLSAGYFLWDLIESARNVDVHVPGSLAHAASALAVSMLGFRPFCNYYGLNFVLYELSTPFLNIHWFMDKLGMTGSTSQLVNGIALITSFGCSRLLWGVYQSVRMYQDMWAAFQTKGGLPIPPWLAATYMISNTTLTALNAYWFTKMVETLRKRFDHKVAGGWEEKTPK